MLVGFSMGEDEIAKYFSLHRGALVSRVVLVIAVVPYMLQTAVNPGGLPQKVSYEMKKGMPEDWPALKKTFNKDFFRVPG